MWRFVAPAFEEIVFRGHLQTLLVGWFDSVARRMREPVAVVAVASAVGAALAGAGPTGSDVADVVLTGALGAGMVVATLVIVAIYIAFTRAVTEWRAKLQRDLNALKQEAETTWAAERNPPSSE